MKKTGDSEADVTGREPSDQERKEQAYLRRQERKRVKEEEEQRRVLAAQEALRKTDIRFMRQAIREARKAAALDEVPIGCVLVKDNVVIARGYNRRNTDKTALAHAEMTAIKRANKKLADWRLEECTLYITLEPCPMCAGAIVQARVKRVCVGCMNEKAGCAGSVLNILNTPGLNHQVEFEQGVLKEECRRLLADFFVGLRRKTLKDDKNDFSFNGK